MSPQLVCEGAFGEGRLLAILPGRFADVAKAESYRKDGPAVRRYVRRVALKSHLRSFPLWV